MKKLLRRGKTNNCYPQECSDKSSKRSQETQNSIQRSVGLTCPRWVLVFLNEHLQSVLQINKTSDQKQAFQAHCCLQKLILGSLAETLGSFHDVTMNLSWESHGWWMTASLLIPADHLHFKPKQVARPASTAHVSSEAKLGHQRQKLHRLQQKTRSSVRLQTRPNCSRTFTVHLLDWFNTSSEIKMLRSDSQLLVYASHDCWWEQNRARWMMGESTAWVLPQPRLWVKPTVCTAPQRAANQMLVSRRVSNSRTGRKHKGTTRFPIATTTHESRK